MLYEFVYNIRSTSSLGITIKGICYNQLELTEPVLLQIRKAMLYRAVPNYISS